MCIFCNIYLVDEINNGYCRKFKDLFSLLHLIALYSRVTTPCWSSTSTLRLEFTTPYQF